jgi:nicotinate-nucleotide adenylyltransferase
VSLRLGVFGGTFDPPHVGHLIIAVNVRHTLVLDTVLLVVAGVPWQKTGSRRISPGPDRLALVQVAVAGVEGLEACSIEVDRPGPSYTADTLVELRSQHRDVELFVILGADAAAGLSTWERADEVRRLATIVVVDRPGSPDSSEVFGDGSEAWERIEVPQLGVSSTDLRARVGDGRPLDFLVPAAVLGEITRRAMYGAPPGPASRGQAGVERT